MPIRVIGIAVNHSTKSRTEEERLVFEFAPIFFCSGLGPPRVRKARPLIHSDDSKKHINTENREKKDCDLLLGLENLSFIA